MKKAIVFFVIAFIFCFAVNAQIITTVAGNGTNGFGGDGGTATSAKFYTPTDVAVDNIGNIYVADYSNNCIRKINPAGIISTISGAGSSFSWGHSGDGGPATAALLYNPSGLAIDNSGNIYIADLWNHRIRKINASGIISTIAGNNIASFYGDGGPASAALFSCPNSVAVDNSGNIYIADENNYRIRKINSLGIINTVAGNGTVGSGGDGGPATAAQFTYPTGVAVDNVGNIYIADESSNRIRKVNTAGIISTIAGNGTAAYSGDGGLATAAELYNPFKIVLDNIGNIYFTDAYNQRIRKINTSGIISTLAGNGTAGYYGDGGIATAAQLNYPSGIAIDISKNIYIADASNERVRKITATTNVPSLTNTANIIHIYPNPAKNIITLEIAATYSQISVLLIDMNGKMIDCTNYLIKTSSNKLTLQTEALPVGNYLLRINVDGNLFTEKVVIDRAK